MSIKSLNQATPASGRTRARLSTSISISTSEEKVLSFSESLNQENELSELIANLWNVEESQLVVLEYGAGAVARVHRRMLYMSRRQKLNHVKSLENYFMACLMRKKRAEPDTERTDEYLAEYLRKQSERGQ